MSKFELVKSYLQEMNIPIIKEDAAEELVVVDDEERGIKNLVIDCEDYILVIEQIIMKINPNAENVFRRLLQMNRCLVHGAFALDESGETLLFRDTLQLENLDRNELEGSIHSLGLALSEYGNELITFAKKD
jgi:hypothetical protein